MTHSKAAPSHAHGNRWVLMVGAIGVVFGDIGTSPLYAIKECFSPESPHHIAMSQGNILGVLSLIFWSITMVVSFKYLTFITRADNEGKGGILALLALVPEGEERKRGMVFLVLLVLFGAALLTGEGVITPAISVLSAMEGLEVATSTLKPAILPLTCVVLVGLFMVQKRGTGGIGKVFGPVTVVWFLTLAALGTRQIIAHPEVLRALNPAYGVAFFVDNGARGFFLLGSVVLAITGVEALYADMGHFGRRPIVQGWILIVCPALLLNYFGQGALLLGNPAAATNPFYALVPAKLLYPVVAIATAATVVASQALISGVFSLIQQAIQLGFFPRVTIVHTSKEAEGQIYIPEVNWGLLIACIGLVLSFRSSSALAAAYGIAVTGTMTITSIVFYVVATRTWKWPVYKALPVVLIFLVFDLSFFAANIVKFFDGGWFPIALGLLLFTIMTTWKRGRADLGAAVAANLLPLETFLEDVDRVKPTRVRGTAVFMASNPNGTPSVLLHNFRHNQILHKQIVLLNVQGTHTPEVSAARRLVVQPLSHDFFRVTVRYGFMEEPNIPEALKACAAQGLTVDLGRTSYYLGRETLLPTGKSGMWRWRKVLFAFISRNARPATAYFGLPPNRVVELGMQIDF